jgi:hypothetical protein
MHVALTCGQAWLGGFTPDVNSPRRQASSCLKGSAGRGNLLNLSARLEAAATSLCGGISPINAPSAREAKDLRSSSPSFPSQSDSSLVSVYEPSLDSVMCACNSVSLQNVGTILFIEQLLLNRFIAHSKDICTEQTSATQMWNPEPVFAAIVSCQIPLVQADVPWACCFLPVSVRTWSLQPLLLPPSPQAPPQQRGLQALRR